MRAETRLHPRNATDTAACATRILLFVFFACGTAVSWAQDAPQRPRFVPGEILVRYRDDVDEPQARRLDAGVRGSSAALLRGGRLRRLRLAEGTAIDDALAQLRRDPRVRYAEPNYLWYPRATPNEAQFREQWGMQNTGQDGGVANADIRATQAWDVTTGSRKVILAIIDSGAQVGPGRTGRGATHPDLAANLWVNPGETAGDGIDNDGNGHIDDIHGWNFYDDKAWLHFNPDPTEDEHGTHLAGIIAAEGNNGVGVAGINWQASLMILKFIGPDGGSTEHAIAAIEYAKRMGAVAINASWGDGEFSQALKDAIEDFKNPFIAAVANDSANSDSTPDYPATFDSPNIIAVAASDNRDQLADFSSFGARGVDLAAPGVDILSTITGSGYEFFSGTSMATPHVTGVVGLIYSIHPTLTPAQVKKRILDSVDRLPSLAGKTLSGGRLNAARAVGVQVTPPPPPPPPPVAGAQDDFESCNFSGGTGWRSAWTLSGAAADRAVVRGTSPHSGSCHLRLRNRNARARRSVSVPNGSRWLLRFAARVDSFENGDRARVQASADGTQWTTLREFTQSDAEGSYRVYELDVSAYGSGGQLHIGFEAAMNNTADRFWVDSITLVPALPAPAGRELR
jgi:subtilisin family serine protease